MTRSDWLWLGAYTLAIAAASVCAYALFVGDAKAHDWYDYSCCSDKDCRPIPFDAVQVTPEGYRVPSGDVIPFASTKIKPTPAEDTEQRFHWCTVAGTDTGHTLCLYVPQGGV